MVMIVMIALIVAIKVLLFCIDTFLISSREPNAADLSIGRCTVGLLFA